GFRDTCRTHCSPRSCPCCPRNPEGMTSTGFAILAGPTLPSSTRDVPPNSVGKHLAQLVGHYRAVRRLQLLHDVADMDLHGAFPQVQLIGDDLVGLATPQRGNDLLLALGEHARERCRLVLQ